MAEWVIRDYDPETDEAPEGDLEHDCTGEGEEDDDGTS